MPYSDLPPGAVVASDPNQYADLPQGATVVSHPVSNPQYNDVGAARLGTPYGQSKPAPSQPGWLQRTAQAGLNLANLAMGAPRAAETPQGQALAAGAAAPATWALQGLGKLGMTSAGNTAANVQDYTGQVLAGTPAAQGRPTSQPNMPPALGGAAYSIGQALPSGALYEASGLAGAISRATSALHPIIQGIVGGGAFGGTSAAMSPVQNPDDYLKNYAGQIATGVGEGAAVGGALGAVPSVIKGGMAAGKMAGSAAGEGVDWIKENYSKGADYISSMKSMTQKLIPADTAASVPTVDDILAKAEYDPRMHVDEIGQPQKLNIQGLQDQSSGLGGNADLAKNYLNQIKIAAAVEHGSVMSDGSVDPINLSLGDIHGDPLMTASENKLQGSFGSVGNKIRTEQLQQLGNAARTAYSDVYGVLSNQMESGEVSPDIQERYNLLKQANDASMQSGTFNPKAWSSIIKSSGIDDSHLEGLAYLMDSTPKAGTVAGNTQSMNAFLGWKMGSFGLGSLVGTPAIGGPLGVLGELGSEFGSNNLRSRVSFTPDLPTQLRELQNSSKNVAMPTYSQTPEPTSALEIHAQADVLQDQANAAGLAGKDVTPFQAPIQDLRSKAETFPSVNTLPLGKQINIAENVTALNAANNAPAPSIQDQLDLLTKKYQNAHMMEDYASLPGIQAKIDALHTQLPPQANPIQDTHLAQGRAIVEASLGSPVVVNSDDELAKVPKGTPVITPTGQEGIAPGPKGKLSDADFAALEAKLAPQHAEFRDLLERTRNAGMLENIKSSALSNDPLASSPDNVARYKALLESGSYEPGLSSADLNTRIQAAVPIKNRILKTGK